MTELLKSAGTAPALGKVEVAGAAEDARLLQALRLRDRKASAELVQLYADPLYGYLQRRLFPRTDLCNDILQDVFIAALDSLPKSERVVSLRPWLFGIARHKVEDHYRRLLRAPQQLEDDSPDGAAVLEPLFEEAIDEARAVERVHHILRSLPERYSAALRWRYWEKRSAAEMAEQTGKTAKAVERLLARARSEFKRRWHEETE